MVSPMLVEIGLSILALGVLVFFVISARVEWWGPLTLAGILITVYGFVKGRRDDDRDR